MLFVCVKHQLQGFGGALRPNGEREGRSPLACVQRRQASARQRSLASAQRRHASTGSARGGARSHARERPDD